MPVRIIARKTKRQTQRDATNTTPRRRRNDDKRHAQTQRERLTATSQRCVDARRRLPTVSLARHSYIEKFYIKITQTSCLVLTNRPQPNLTQRNRSHENPTHCIRGPREKGRKAASCCFYHHFYKISSHSDNLT